MGDPDLDEFEPTVAAPIGAINENYNLNNERLDCERIGNPRYFIVEAKN